jgi:hypothetical protein
VEQQEVLQVLQMQAQAELVEMEKELQLEPGIQVVLETTVRSQVEVVEVVEVMERVMSQVDSLSQIMVG